ncbi:MAG: DNA ligase-1 [Rickettsiales bacterium]|jgi:DNA ligase-1
MKPKNATFLFFILQIIFLFFEFSNELRANSQTEETFPPIQLANIYHSGIDLENYLISEKLDGVRVYFDGQNLISKRGNIYNAPKWFTQNFPKEVFEGELWIGKGKFAEASGIVRRKIPDEEWKRIRLMIFDLPNHQGTFFERYESMKNLVIKSPSKYLQLVDQFKVKDEKELMDLLDDVVKNGGEGLMLHDRNSFYEAKRNDAIMKLKKFEDAEAKILKYFDGKGKYQGMMGSILVKNEEGRIFKIGGGFSDHDRQNPPKIGSIITYKFYGKTKNGKPRFASFLRVREDYDFKEIFKEP